MHNWIKKIKQKHIIVIVLFLTIVIPFIINFLFKYSFIEIFKSEWEAGDALNFYGTLLSFFGSVLLGYVALSLSEKSNCINERLYNLEKAREEHETRPFVMLSNFEAKEEDFIDVIYEPKKIYIGIGEFNNNDSICERYLCISMLFINTSFSFTTLDFGGAEVYDNETIIGTWKSSYCNQKTHKKYLKSGDAGEIAFFASKETMLAYCHKKIKMNLILENRFGNHYIETFEIFPMILHEDSNSSWYIHIHAQRYEIE